MESRLNKFTFSFCHLFYHYPARSAFTIFNLAARTDGKNPPRIPITAAKNKVQKTISGDNANENASSENELKLSVDIEMNCSKEASAIPISPPRRAIDNDSVKNAIKILLLLKPSARNVPTSTVLFATEAYIVIIAPIVAPKLKITVMNKPRNLINPAICSDCSSKYFCSGFATNC